MLGGGCLIGARYTMLADVVRQTATRDPDSGQISRVWDYEHPGTVRNLTVGILGGGIRVVGSTEMWGEDYEEIEWAKMYISSQLIKMDVTDENLNVIGEENVYITRRWRVTNIRQDDTGKYLWIGDDGEPIVFNIMGITPIMDPFGDPVEYELLLKGETGD
jgi:hypothetical protein